MKTVSKDQKLQDVLQAIVCEIARIKQRQTPGDTELIEMWLENMEEQIEEAVTKEVR